MRLIPAIDLKEGRCVRLLRGEFDAETRYSEDPPSVLTRFRNIGATWLHIVDLDGARDGFGGNRAIIVELARQPDMRLQVGGGLRHSAAVADMLNAGAARAVIGSAAVTDVESVRGWLDVHGADRIVLAFDVRLDSQGVPRVATHGWRQQSDLTLWDALSKFVQHGLRHVLCTDVSRDGALSGPNIELYTEAVRNYPTVAWQASGGIRNAGDLHTLARIGVSAAISGKALLEDLIPIEELRAFLPNASFPA